MYNIIYPQFVNPNLFQYDCTFINFNFYADVYDCNYEYVFYLYVKSNKPINDNDIINYIEYYNNDNPLRTYIPFYSKLKSPKFMELLADDGFKYDTLLRPGFIKIKHSENDVYKIKIPIHNIQLIKGHHYDSEKNKFRFSFLRNENITYDKSFLKIYKC